MSTNVELIAGEYQALIDLHGGGLQGLWHRDHPLVQTYPENTPAPLSAGQVLAPWPNRTSDGVFAVDGQVYSLAVNEPARNNAIHGVCNTVEWEVVEAGEASVSKEIGETKKDHQEKEARETNEIGEAAQWVRLRTQVGSRGSGCEDRNCGDKDRGGEGREGVVRAGEPKKPSWPWRLEVESTWTLDPELGLRVEWTARNCDERRQPFGLGWHPYLSALGAPLDECVLRLEQAETCVPLDPAKMVPCGVDIPVPEELSFGEGLPMAGVQMDHCFGVRADDGTRSVHAEQVGAGERAGEAELASGSELGSTVTLLTQQGEGVQLQASGDFCWYQVYVSDPANGEGYPEIGRAVAVEPMTCPADALRSGRGLVWLEPGEARAFDVRVGALRISD